MFLPKNSNRIQIPSISSAHLNFPSSYSIRDDLLNPAEREEVLLITGI